MNASVRRPCDTALALATWPWAIRGRGLGAVDLELPGSKVWLICGKLIYCCVHKSLTILLLIKVHIYICICHCYVIKKRHHSWRCKGLISGMASFHFLLISRSVFFVFLLCSTTCATDFCV